MSNELVTVEITREAADCLAWFTQLEFCGDTLSEVIVWNAGAYCGREHWDDHDVGIEGSFRELFEEEKQNEP